MTSKFKENVWCGKELKGKRKLRYYKEAISPNPEDQNYFLVLTSAKKKTKVAKIRTKSHKLHGESGHWKIPKTPLDERICHLFDTKRVEYEEHFLLECTTYTQIKSQFQNICHNVHLPNLLSHQSPL
jgi:hypothetical protein